MNVNVVMKTVSLANGENIGYRERDGGSKQLLLIHGNMTSSKHWDILLEQLDPSFKVFAVDLRGFGASSYHNPIRQIKDFADDIKLFVDVLELKNFSMIGWSTGGAVAMEFCADYPGYCSKLILLASASTRGYPFFATDELGNVNPAERLKSLEEVKRDSIRTIPIQAAYDTGNREVLKTIWNSLIYSHKQPEYEKYEEYVEDMMTQRNLAEVYHALNTFNISATFNGLVEGSGKANRINIPILVLRGNNDLVITDQMTKETMEDLGEVACFEELVDCGHSPLIDNLELLNNKITKFLDK